MKNGICVADVIQFISIACSLTTLCYSIVSFHQVQGFTKRHNVIPMSLLGCIAHVSTMALMAYI